VHLQLRPSPGSDALRRSSASHWDDSAISAKLCHCGEPGRERGGCGGPRAKPSAVAWSGASPPLRHSKQKHPEIALVPGLGCWRGVSTVSPGCIFLGHRLFFLPQLGAAAHGILSTSSLPERGAHAEGGPTALPRPPRQACPRQGAPRRDGCPGSRWLCSRPRAAVERRCPGRGGGRCWRGDHELRAGQCCRSPRCGPGSGKG